MEEKDVLSSNMNSDMTERKQDGQLEGTIKKLSSFFYFSKFESAKD